MSGSPFTDPSMAARSDPGGPRSPADRGALLVWEYLIRGWRRYLLSSTAEAVGAPLLYLLAMGVGLGTLVDREAGPPRCREIPICSSSPRPCWWPLQCRSA